MRGLGLLTLDNYRTVFTAGSYGPLVANTLLIAAASATATLLITVFASWLAVRRKPGAWALDQLATTTLVFPGVVLGVAMIQIFLRDRKSTRLNSSHT